MKTYVILNTWGGNRYDYDLDINTQSQVWQDGEGLTENVRKSIRAQGEMTSTSNSVSWSAIDVIDCATGTLERVFHKKKPLLTRTELNVAAKTKKSAFSTPYKPDNMTAANLLAAQWTSMETTTLSEEINP